MKKMLGLALLALVPATAMAVHDGPFANVAALNSYWTGTSTGGALTQIYVDGTKVFQRSGFGPAYEQQYFNCWQTSDIRPECQVGDIGSHDEHLAHQVAKYPGTATVYLDGSLYRSGSPGITAYVITCAGDSSYYAPGWVTYYATEAYYDGWIPYSGFC